MMFEIFLTLLSLVLTISPVLAGTTTALAPRTRESRGSLKYKVVPMIFNGTVGNVKNVEMSGSVQEIIAKVKATHLQYSDDSNNVSPGSASVENGIGGRTALNKEPPRCCPVASWGWEPAGTHFTGDNIVHLQRFSGTCGVPARTCVRVACEYCSAIFLCNDNYYDISPNCGYIASYAQDLVNNCGVVKWKHRGDSTCGQQFDTDHYDVIVRSDCSNGCG